ncbi:DUF6706 family protein [Emticicia sp. 17c]|uniref:DUF6706 family protein n=1 Tax=Emticicia sp. 17c TaxID=3127704 RepID=UPI00301D677C
MLVADYIKSKLLKFGVTLSTDHLQALLLKNGIASEETYTGEGQRKAEQALHAFIPELLVVSGVTEGGFSISYDREGILAYYRLLSEQLNQPDALTPAQPRVRNKSYLW